MASHRKPREPQEQAKPGKRRLLVPLVVVLCLGGAASGGAAMAGAYSSPTPLSVNLAGASGSTNPGVTVYACLASGKLSHVSVTAAPKCPANTVPVHWTGQTDPTSSPTTQPPPTMTSNPPTSSPPVKPTSTPTTPAPVTSSTTPSTPPTQGPACVTSKSNGSCGPYTYSAITGSSGSSTYVLNNMWAANSGTTQTLTSTGPGSWSVLANAGPAGNTGVQTYPDTQQIYTRSNNTPDPLSSFSSYADLFVMPMSAELPLRR